jgi:hypothetical protein
MNSKKKVQGANRRFLKKLNDLNDVDLGRSSYDQETFYKLFKLINSSDDIASFETKYKKLINQVDFFLQQDIRKNFNPLNKLVILELMYLFIQSLIPFSEQETKNRASDKKSLRSPKSNLDNTNHINGKVHYLQELYFYLCYGPNSSFDNLENNILKISPKLARDTIAKWTILFDTPLNSEQESSEGLILKRSEAIQKASRRWNVRQAPNQRRGVYLGSVEIIEEIVDGRRTQQKKLIVLTDDESLEKYRPKYPKFTPPSQCPES